jgi:hypothetical protein
VNLNQGLHMHFLPTAKRCARLYVSANTVSGPV